LYRTHYLIIDKRKLETTVPNFAGGGGLPRADQEDRVYYCCTMITLFKPWREGIDLKGKLDSWDNIFNVTKFTSKTKRMMKNFNLCFECNDERDDYYNQNKTGPVPMFSRFDRDSQTSVDQDQDFFAYGADEDITRPYVSMQGSKYMTMLDHMKEAAGIMKKSGLTRAFSFLNFDCTRFRPTRQLSGSQWKARISIKPEKLLTLNLKAHRMTDAKNLPQKCLN
jgi:hypothetical protein